MAAELHDDLWFHDATDDPAEQAAADSMVAAVADLIELRPFPDSAARLMGLLRDPNFSVRELSRIIEHDPLLAMRVLKLVNSAAYRLSAPCGSVEHAVTLLGSRSLTNLVTSIAVLEMFKDRAGAESQVRDHSLAAAGMARQLAQLARTPHDEIITCALLHDIGKLLLLQVNDPGYPELLAPSAEDPRPTHERERARFGYDHAVLAGHVLRRWQIPEPVPTVVAWHHQPERTRTAGTDPALARLVALVRLADLLSYTVGEQELSDDTRARVDAESPATELGLETDRIVTAWPELRQTAQDWIGAIGA
ncbi:MAG: HDOD domain-containing protein [Deltaproteobacteria bacterium]|nr:HDOD domain-containing protein [Deltaproteobacteria bacterium]